MKRKPSIVAQSVRRRVRGDLILLATLCPALGGVLLRPPVAVAADKVASAEVQTEHYSLYVEKLDAEEFGRLLEAFHTQMTRAFGKAPEGKLRFELYADAKRFMDALERDGEGRIDDAGGYFSHRTKTAYLYIQPSSYFTRQLALHECAHQFHLLARANNRSPRAGWYVEGLAEHYGTHNWDGKTLQFCTLPAMTLEDYPAKALTAFNGKHERDIGAIVTGKTKAERPISWALVHYLNQAEPEKFKALSEKLDALTDPRVAWRSTFGDVTPAMTEAFEAWLRANQQPWEVKFVEWQQRGDAFEGRSDTTAVALLKQSPAMLTAAIEASEKGTMPGLIYDYQSGDDHRTIQLMPSGKLRLGHRKGGKWQTSSYLALPPRKAGESHDVLAIVPGGEEGTVTLRANGVDVATKPGAGRVGLYVQEGQATFRVAVKNKDEG